MIIGFLFPPSKRVHLYCGQIGHTIGIQSGDWKFQRDVLPSRWETRFAQFTYWNDGPEDLTFLSSLNTEIDSQLMFGAVVNEKLSVVPGEAVPEVVLR